METIERLVSELPELARSPAGRRLLPQGIADLLARDPQAAAPSVAALENLLGHADEKVRFSAACALAGTRLDDPRIREMLSKALSNPDEVLTSAEAPAKAGPKAAAFAPALLELANREKNEYLRAELLRALAKIQPDAAETIPEVAQVLDRDASARGLGSKLENGAASVADLVAALRLPQYAIKAASQLGDVGAPAAHAIPALLESLQGRDEAAREQIVEAIFRIDPQTRIERVDARIARARFRAALAQHQDKREAASGFGFRISFGFRRLRIRFCPPRLRHRAPASLSAPHPDEMNAGLPGGRRANLAVGQGRVKFEFEF